MPAGHQGAHKKQAETSHVYLTGQTFANYYDKALSSSTGFALDLDATFCCKLHSISCLRGARLASRKKPPLVTSSTALGKDFPASQGAESRQGVILRSNISPFYMAPLLLAHPGGHGKMISVLGEQVITLLGPTRLVIFCICPHVAVSYLAFSTGWISLASPNYFLTDVGMFCYLKQSSTTAHTPQPNLMTAEHPTKPLTLILPPQHGVALL